jgi:quinohemoprotein amine dehydrogenase
VSIGLARILRSPALLLAIVLVVAPGALAAQPATDGRTLIRSYCSGCHLEKDGRFERISSIRMTPEGWVMTLFRMRQVHGLVLSDDVEERIVRFLSDTQGLAPSEALPGRFALERRPNAQDLDRGPEMGVMCGRCHTLARSALQRRGADEWLKLVHMHVGQWPSLEYQASGRDRPWWQIASTQLPAKLAALYPFDSATWTEWRARPARDPAGSWVVVGHEPGGRDFYGTAEIVRGDSGGYTARYHLTDLGGAAVAGGSHAFLYTGYEWRGRGELGGRAAREVFALSADGARLSGRWFDPAHAEEGGDWNAIRADAAPAVLAVLPRALKAGATGVVTVIGTGLASPEAVSFGAGTTARIVSRAANVLRAELKVAAAAEPGARTVTAGTASAAGLLAIYRQIDRIDVVPGFGIARLGGGKLAPVTAQFEALAATRLPGGEFLSLGPVAAEWSALPFDEDAKRADDPRFAGRLEGNGRYLPAGAGPNRAREFSGNNVGNLAIVARVKDGEGAIEGRSHLVVTVQRWNTPPIY